MKPFAYMRAQSLEEAMASAAEPGTRLLAGGTTLVDLMKLGVEQPARVVDMTALPGLDTVHVDGQRIRLGALVRMASAAVHVDIVRLAPAVSQSLWRAASAQLRNMATLGGNLLQRTRCAYFRDVQAYAECNKRAPGSGCAARQGITRNHAIFGASASCLATHPGDLAVALVAFDARIEITGRERRLVAVRDFFRIPGDTPQAENQLRPGELITAVEIPLTAGLQRSHYLKVRDRSSYEFAVVSAAAGIVLEEDGRTVRTAHLAAGGVGTVPWRLPGVEQALMGRPFTEAAVRAACADASAGAEPTAHNRHKAVLLPRVAARALMAAGGMA